MTPALLGLVILLAPALLPAGAIAAHPKDHPILARLARGFGIGWGFAFGWAIMGAIMA